MNTESMLRSLAAVPELADEIRSMNGLGHATQDIVVVFTEAERHILNDMAPSVYAYTRDAYAKIVLLDTTRYGEIMSLRGPCPPGKVLVRCQSLDWFSYFNVDDPTSEAT